MKRLKDIKLMISDENISDSKVKKVLSRLNSFEICKDEKLEILALLKEARLNLFTIWQLEIASEFM